MEGSEQEALARGGAMLGSEQELEEEHGATAFGFGFGMALALGVRGHHSPSDVSEGTGELGGALGGDQ